MQQQQQQKQEEARMWAVYCPPTSPRRIVGLPPSADPYGKEVKQKVRETMRRALVEDGHLPGDVAERAKIDVACLELPKDARQPSEKVLHAKINGGFFPVNVREPDGTDIILPQPQEPTEEQSSDSRIAMQALESMFERKLRAVEERLRADVGQLQVENKQLREENKLLREENKQLREDSKQLRADVGQLQVENKQLREENKHLRADVEQLQVENKQLQEENKHLRADVEQLQVENKQLQEENKHLRADMEQLKNKIASVVQGLILCATQLAA